MEARGVWVELICKNNLNGVLFLFIILIEVRHSLGGTVNLFHVNRIRCHLLIGKYGTIQKFQGRILVHFTYQVFLIEGFIMPVVMDFMNVPTSLVINMRICCITNG